MRFLRLVCACGVLALAAAATAGTAQAEPEFLTKAAVKEGQKIPFSFSGGTMFTELGVGSAYTCSSESGTGEVEGAHSIVNMQITIPGCEALAGFTSEVLTGTLGPIATTKSGLKLFSQAEGRAGVFARTFLGGTPATVTGAIIGTVTSSGTDAKTAKLNGSTALTWEKSGRSQKYLEFNEGPEAGIRNPLELAAGEGQTTWAWSGHVTIDTVPTTWDLGITEGSAPEFVTKVAVQSGEHIPVSGTLGAVTIEGTAKDTVTCTGGTVAGEVTGPRSMGHDVITLTGCESGGAKCASAGEAEGTVKTTVLYGAMNGLTASLPGVRLYPEAGGRGATLASFACGAATVTVRGSVLGDLNGPSGTNPETGKLLTSNKLTFAQAEGIQKYVKFVEGPEANQAEQLEVSNSAVLGGTYHDAGLAAVWTSQTVPPTWGLGVTK
jgi:hypothetical protein